MEVTTTNITTVKLSNWNDHETLKNSVSIQGRKLTKQVFPQRATSQKAVKLQIKVRPKRPVEIIAAPWPPRIKPKKPEAIEPNKGRKTRLKYINK